MPFINSKVSVELNNEKKEELKAALGQIIKTIPGKSEAWLMAGFEDNCSLYFKGDNSSPSAFIEVKIFGSASSDVYNQMTAKLCDLYNSSLSIPKDRIYVKYEEVKNWGWNGMNF